MIVIWFKGKTTIPLVDLYAELRDSFIIERRAYDGEENKTAILSISRDKDWLQFTLDDNFREVDAFTREIESRLKVRKIAEKSVAGTQVPRVVYPG